jgi:hypothetical protein
MEAEIDQKLNGRIIFGRHFVQTDFCRSITGPEIKWQKKIVALYEVRLITSGN